MIQAFRFGGKIVLKVQSASTFETALLASTSFHSIGLVTLSVRAGFSRYRLARQDEGRFSQYLGVVFRRWPRHEHEHRVRAEIRKLNGNLFFCKSTGRQINLTAPSDAAAKVRCGLHAGTHNWTSPSCDQA
jgi:hypothetical protein